MLRTASVVLAGAMLVGCESNRVVGDRSYGDDGSVVRRVDADSVNRVDANPVGRVDATGSSVERVDAAGDKTVQRVDAQAPVIQVPPSKVTRVDAGNSSVTRVTPDDHSAVKRTDVEVTRRTDDARPAADRTGTPGGAADPERAAFANTAKFPKDLKPTDDHHLTAVVDKRAQTIKIANASDRPLRNVHVWVNGTYVMLVPEIPANRTATMKFGEFSDRAGATITDPNVSTIQVEAGDQLYNAQGPVFE